MKEKFVMEGRQAEYKVTPSINLAEINLEKIRVSPKAEVTELNHDSRTESQFRDDIGSAIPG